MVGGAEPVGAVARDAPLDRADPTLADRALGRPIRELPDRERERAGDKGRLILRTPPYSGDPDDSRRQACCSRD